MQKSSEATGEHPSMSDVFVQFFVRDIEHELGAIEGSLAQCDVRLKVAEERLAAELGTQQGLIERRKEIRDGENFGAEYDSLLKNKKIATVDVQSNPDKIIVVTTELCIPFDDKKYFIDPLRIEVSFDMVHRGHNWAGDFGPISVFPSHPQQKISPFGYPNEGPNWPAPHVRADGSICLGNIHGTVVGAWNKHEWAAVVELMIEFLESCNPDRRDAYFMVLKNVAIRVE